MKYLISLILVLVAFVSSNAQDIVSTISIPPETQGTNRVYAELLGHGTNLLGLNKNVNVTIDLGQFQSAFKPYTILDEDGNAIKFNSMVAAMNYMGNRGWKFVQAYVITESNKQNVYHWLMYKDITDPSQLYEGLRVKNTETEPEKPKKPKSEKSKSQVSDPLYGN